MPIYEYECKNCGKRFEKLQSITSDALTECIICKGGPIRRIMHPVGVIFKGSGWYITDNRKSSSSEDKSASKPSTESSSDAKKDDKESPAASDKADTSPPASSSE